MLKCASTVHFSAPCLMLFTSARCPITSPSAPSMMLFPAPVSPVITEKPERKSMSSSSISAKFLIYSCVSMSFFYFFPSVVLACIDFKQQVVHGLFLFLCAFSLVNLHQFVSLIVGPYLRQHAQWLVFLATFQPLF